MSWVSMRKLQSSRVSTYNLQNNQVLEILVAD